jgi:FixJ family two-component response regulator
VLLVDDNVESRNLCAQYLRHAGWEAHAVANLRRDATKFLTKPCPPQDLLSVLETMVQEADARQRPGPVKRTS